MRQLKGPPPSLGAPSRCTHRVLHVIDGLHAGGAERVLVTLVRQLGAPEVEHSLLLLYDVGPLLELVPAECAVYGADGDPLSSLMTATARTRPDVLQSWVDEAAVLAATVSAATGIPHLHRIPNIPSAQYRLHPRGHRFLRSFRLALEQARAVCALSHAAADDAVSYLGIDRPYVVHNGFPLATAPCDVEDRKPTGTLLLTMVGRLAVEKGHGVLIEALPEIVRRHPDARCWFVGTGPLEGALRQQIREHGLDDQVRLLGHRDDVTPILAQTDVFVLPSLYEGFCNALTEAMRAACCVVASELPVIKRDVLERGDEVVLCTPGSARSLAAALLRVLEMPERRIQLGQAARRSAGRFGLGAMVRGFRTLYDVVRDVRRDAAA